MFGGDGGPDALATPTTSDERDAAAKRRDARSSDARDSEPEAGPSKAKQAVAPREPPSSVTTETSTTSTAAATAAR